MESGACGSMKGLFLAMSLGGERMRRRVRGAAFSTFARGGGRWKEEAEGVAIIRQLTVWRRGSTMAFCDIKKNDASPICPPSYLPSVSPPFPLPFSPFIILAAFFHGKRRRAFLFLPGGYKSRLSD